MSSGKKQKTSLAEYGFRTDAEKLIAYLQAEIQEINNKDKEKLHRVMTLKSLLFEHHSSSKVIPMHMKAFDVSEATAWRDLRLVDLIFGPMERVSKDMRRAIAERMILKTRELAELRKDIATMQRCDLNYIKLYNLDKEDAELPDLSNFDFHPLIVAVLPEQVGINPLPDDEIAEKLNSWWQKQAQDVEFNEQGDENP